MIVVTIDSHVRVPPQWAYSPSTASTVLSAVAGAVAALTGFVVTVTVLVVQMATGTFSARYMRLWYRDPVLKGAWARQHDCLVVMRHSVGEFLETGDLLFEVHGDPGETAAAERALRGFVAMGLERTIEQDPAFALRVMVDVANKALSPAVNDPTTAVQVLDYLGDSLRVIGEADLSVSLKSAAERPAAPVG